jgi:histidyl-tRNA synthetase
MMRAAMELAERLRDAGLRTLLNCGNGVLKTQLKRADRSGARYAAMLGAESAGQGNIVLKDLHSGDQSEFSAVDQIISYLKQKLA